MNNAPSNGKKTTIAILVSILVLILILVFLLSKDMERVSAFIRSSGWIGVVVGILFYALLGASPVPSEPFTLLITTAVGPREAILVAGLGNTLSGLIEYFFGHKIGDVADFEQRKSRLPFGLGKAPVDSPLFLIVGRMLPGYGPKLVSLISGIYKVPVWRALWTNALTSFLGAVIFAYGGFGLLTLIK
jgi:uncharacterized membrane protein YdjX (TVP38/TMEM64 family)